MRRHGTAVAESVMFDDVIIMMILETRINIMLGRPNEGEHTKGRDGEVEGGNWNRLR